MVQVILSLIDSRRFAEALSRFTLLRSVANQKVTSSDDRVLSKLSSPLRMKSF